MLLPGQFVRSAIKENKMNLIGSICFFMMLGCLIVMVLNSNTGKPDHGTDILAVIIYIFCGIMLMIAAASAGPLTCA